MNFGPLKSLSLRSFSLDRSILFTISNRFIQAAGQLLAIYFISRFLSKPEQGYYYTFSSIAAAQVFFELGLSVVITQFVAHEFAFLSIDKMHHLEGDHKHIARLASLLRFIAKWYFWAAIGLLVIVTPIGYWFFYSADVSDEIIQWQWPWIILMVGTSLTLLLSAYIPFIDGLNKVEATAQFKMAQTVISLSILCASIYFNMGLLGLGLFTLSNFLVLTFWIWKNSLKPLVIFLWKNFDEEIIINWKTEILPFQWRIALSWLSGYFIFQIFNPIAFAIEGPVAAGQMGITLTAFNGISIIAMAWVSTKIPIFSILVAQQRYTDLDALFFKAMKQSFFLVTGAVIAFLIVLETLQIGIFPNWKEIGLRFLPINLAIFVGLSTVFNQVVFSMAVYLRSHKKEPLLINSLVAAGVTFLSAYFFSKWYGMFGMVVSSFICTFFFGLLWVSFIFITKRNQWHNKVDEV